MEIECDDPTEVVKEMAYLAWKAAKLYEHYENKDKPDATKKDVWKFMISEGCLNERDGNLDIGHIFWRQVNLAIEWDDASVTCDDDDDIDDSDKETQTWRETYYGGYQDLYDKAQLSLMLQSLTKNTDQNGTTSTAILSLVQKLLASQTSQHGEGSMASKNAEVISGPMPSGIELLQQLLSGKVLMQSQNITIDRTGDKIILPEGMTFAEAIEWLKRKSQEEEKQVAVYHEMEYQPLDGAVAFHKALANLYGWTDLRPTPGFWGPTPPTLIGVITGPKPEDRIQVPWGTVAVPNVDGTLKTGIKFEPTPRFTLSGSVKAKCLPAIQAIVQETIRILETESIYRGKAIKTGFQWQREGKDYDPTTHCPRFWDTTGVAENDLILSQVTSNALRIGLFAPIEYPEACRKFGIPLKRGIILSGRYGVGKTLAAAVTAKKAISKQWTFIYLDSVLDLEQGLRMASQYAPAVVFAEDIDQVMGTGRTKEMNDVLNTIDGVDTKGAEIITVLTTNHVDKINPAFLRPGRIDSLIEVTPPDAEAAARLVEKYGRGLFAPDTDFTAAGEKLEGRIPAVIREVTERAKIAAVERTKGDSILGKVLIGDVLDAAEAMQVHANMLETDSGKAKTDENAWVMAQVPRDSAQYKAIKELVTSANGK